jgi:hypothetical protein
MKEKEAYVILDWPHAGIGNDGEDWLAFRCLTPGCQSEGVSRRREYDFGRCGICGAIMEVVESAHEKAKPGTPARPQAASKPQQSAKPTNVPNELASARKLHEQLEELVIARGECPDEDRNILLMGYWALIFDFHKAILGLIPDNCGSAFALVRPCLEALVRAHVAVKGSAEDIKNGSAQEFVEAHILSRFLKNGTPLISPGSALVANSLCRGQGKLMMRESEVKSEIPD